MSFVNYTFALPVVQSIRTNYKLFFESPPSVFGEACTNSVQSLTLGHWTPRLLSGRLCSMIVERAAQVSTIDFVARGVLMAVANRDLRYGFRCLHGALTERTWKRCLSQAADGLTFLVTGGACAYCAITLPFNPLQAGVLFEVVRSWKVLDFV